MGISDSKYARPSEALVRDALEPYGVKPSDVQVELIQRYIDTLLLWNQKVRLTTVRRPREILERHFGESMFAASRVPICQGRLADVGSGAGFPGLPLKIVCPELDVVLIEANHKKAAFLAEVNRRLGLGGIEVLGKRMEDLQVRPGFVDFVSARAVGGFRRLLKWSRDALTNEGRLLLWLGGEDANRVAGASEWRWRKPIRIPNSLRRVLLIGQPRSV